MTDTPGSGAFDDAGQDFDEVGAPVKSVLGGTFALLFRNYWRMALIGVAVVFAKLLISALLFIPLLGQLLGLFFYSLTFSLALLAALAVARRAPALTYLTPALAPMRLLELAVVLFPIGLIEVINLTITRFLTFGAGLFWLGGGSGLGILMIYIWMVLYLLIYVWGQIKFGFAPFFVAAAPSDAAPAPFARMGRSMRLTRGKFFGYALVYMAIGVIGLLFGLIPFLGSVVISAVFSTPLQICALIVIYHRLTVRPLAGLQRRVKTASDLAADDTKPV